MATRSEGVRSQVRIEVTRVKSGSELYVRTLSESYSGLMTHFLQLSQYHDPDEKCPWCSYRAPLAWKGYFAAELWDVPRKLWVPTVFELTESSELDLRGVYARAQVWRFKRPPDSKRGRALKRYPTVGVLQENLDGSKLTPAFDVLPVLRTMYHCPTLHLGIENPTAERIFASPVEGAPPAAFARSSEAPAGNNESIKDFARRLKDMRAPSVSNGEIMPGQ